MLRKLARTSVVLMGVCLLHPIEALTAQTGSMRASVPSPTAASLGTFGDVPVSLASGLPDVSIPLFTVRGTTLEVPITLRYAGGGIRVEEIGGWVGVGWSLDAGGVITRTVRGIADEELQGYWYTGHTWYEDDNWLSPSFELIGQVASGQIDGEPDQFFFNFAGRTGQFVMGPIDTTGTAREIGTIPHQRLRIDTIGFGGQDPEWRITTEDGTRYTFAARETTTDLHMSEPPSMPSSGGDHTSSWYLTEIRAPGGDVVTFHYSEYTAHHQHVSYVGQNSFIVENPPGSCVPSNVMSTNTRQLQALRLDSIISARHTVRFESDSLRADALHPTEGTPQEPRLDRIVVLTPDQTVLRVFELEYDHFGGNRLRLDAVSERDPGGASLPPWSFAYDPQSFPDRDSKAQDHWGYWNGADNSTLLPPAMTPHGILLQGGDRNPDAERMTVGALTAVTYPTGGFTEFTWEPNDYGRIGSDSAHVLDRGSWQDAGASAIELEQIVGDTFTVGGVEPALVFVQVIIQDPDSTCNVQCSSGSIEGVGSWESSIAGHQVMLSPGTYVLEAYRGTWGGTAEIRVDWQDVEIAKSAPAGGLRLARLETDDGLGNIQVRRYRYTLQSDTARSSGLLPAEPRYHYNFESPHCSYFSRSSMSKMPLGGGAPVEYSEVTVLLGEEGEFGSRRETFRTFTDQPDPPAPHLWWPYLRATTYDWKRGQPVESVEYNGEGELQEHSRTTYAFRDAVPATTRHFRGMSVNSFSSVGGSSDYIYSPFLVISAWHHASADTTTVYDEDGGDSFTTVRTYAHENPEHTQLTELTETNSDGTQRITRMRYPADYDVAGGTPDDEVSALAAMKGDAHMHSAVIERWVTEISGAVERVVEAELTTFRAVAGGYLPFRRFVLDRADPRP